MKKRTELYQKRVVSDTRSIKENASESSPRKPVLRSEQYRNSIRLRWTVNKVSYSLTVGSLSKGTIQKAELLKSTILYDIGSGGFDVTLEKYKKLFTPEQKSPADITDKERRTRRDVLSLYDKWTHPCRMYPVPSNVLLVRTMIKSWKPLSLDHLFDKVFEQTWSPNTFNVRKNILKRFFEWLKGEYVVTLNPFEKVPNRRKTQPTARERMPYSDEQIHRLLEAFRTDQFSESAVYPQSQYYPFLKFLFYTGVRNGEATGLQVDRVDFEKRVITIDQSYSRAFGKPSNAKNRVLKNTKTGTVRKLPMDQEMIDLLRPCCKGKRPDDFVFSTRRGFPIDDQQFQKRVLYPVQELLGIPRHHLYACRHTFGTVSVEQGFTPLEAGYLMGHNNPKTIMERYAHLRTMPKRLPSFKFEKKHTTDDPEV